MASSGGVSSGEGKCEDRRVHISHASVELSGPQGRCLVGRSVKLTSEVGNTATDRIGDLPKE